MEEKKDAYQQYLLRKQKFVEERTFCRLHKRYQFWIPLGQRKGYPENIDFKKIPFRMKKVKPILNDIIRKNDQVSSG